VTIGGWLRHHAWRKHRKSPSSTKNNGVSWGRNVAEPSDSTWPTDAGHDSSLMNTSTTRKSSNEYGLFVDVTSGVREDSRPYRWRPLSSDLQEDYTHHYIHCHTHCDHGMPEAWLEHRVQWGLGGCQILVSQKQEPWLPLQWSTIEQVRWLKYSPRGPVNMRKNDWVYLREVKHN